MIVAESSGGGGEAEVGILRATKELGGDIAVQRSPGLVIEGITQRLRRRIPGDHHRMPRTVLDVGQPDRGGSEGTVSADETSVIRDNIGIGLRIDENVGIGVELDRQTIANPGRPQSAAGTPNRSHTARIVVKDHRRPIGTEVIGTEIDLEGEGEISTHIDALARHRRPHLIKPVTRRGQRNDITGDTRSAPRRQTPIRCRDDRHRRLAFEGGGGAHAANTLGVAQPASRGTESEVNELRATEELRDEVSGQRPR